MNKSKEFIKTAIMEWEDMGGGVKRKILGYDNQIMMVKVHFKKGAEGTPHAHFHTQATYCVEGKFEFDIEGKKEIIEAGDGVYIPPNAIHGAICLEEGTLIDVFSPVREDFLDGSQVSYFGSEDQ